MSIKYTPEMERIARILNKKSKTSCKRCSGHHAIEINLPTAKSQWYKGGIHLGIFLTVPCHECHPKYFKKWMTEIKEYINPTRPENKILNP